MNKYFIIEYINKLTKNDYYKYLKKNNISIEEKDLDFLFNYIKKNKERILDNPITHLNYLKTVLPNNTYKTLEQLYYKYQTYL
ncbi:MAG: hypothetical protein Q4G04_03970 [bacterium]|nr:hypothetical protein [bacterium]